jgi:hypothetical protein
MSTPDTTQDTLTDRLVSTATIAIVEMECDTVDDSPGEIDRASFSHKDWAISWSAGKAAYVCPADVQELEEKLKAARDAAKAAGTATKTTGNSFWTIKRPGS